MSGKSGIISLLIALGLIGLMIAIINTAQKPTTPDHAIDKTEWHILTAVDVETGLALPPSVSVLTSNGQKDPIDAIPGYHKRSLRHTWPTGYTGLIEVTAQGYSTQRIEIHKQLRINAVLISEEKQF